MSIKQISLSLMAMLVIVFVLISIISDDSVEGKKEDGNKQRQRSGQSAEKLMGDMKRPPSSYMNDFSHDEVRVGGKRFKLFEKKHLNYKKATAFCKKKDGKLAQAMNLDEMRRLQMLLMRARTIGDDMWIGADKKEWKKHSLKMQRKPNFGPDPMLFGGGPTEMCPALSVSTRSLTPVMCTKDLAFICEFEDGKRKSTKSQTASSTKSKTTKSPSKKSSGTKATNKVKRNKNKIEMRRRKREIIIQTPNPSIPAATSKGDDSDDSDDDDDGTSTETTEIYATENSVSAAAEHKIGFVPHVEHLHLQQNNNHAEATSEIYNNDNMEKLVTDRSETNNDNDINPPPRNIHQVKVSTKIIIDIENNDNNNILKSSATTNSRTTTLDPDQLLMDMIDEQTMNLTAIEMEAEAEAAASRSMNNVSSSSSSMVTQNLVNSTDSLEALDKRDNNDSKGKLRKISEYIDDNDLSFVSDNSVSATSRPVSATTDDPTDEEELSMSKLRERSSMGGMLMKEDINVTLSMSTSSGIDVDDLENGEMSYNSTDTATATVAENEDGGGGGSSVSPSFSTSPVPFTTTIIGTTVIEVSIEVDDINNSNDDNNNKRAMRNASQSIEGSSSNSSSTKAENSTVEILPVEDEQQGVNNYNNVTEQTIVPVQSSTINETLEDATESSITNMNVTSYSATLIASQLPVKSKPVLIVTQTPVLINDTISIMEDFEGSSSNSSNISSTEQQQQQTTASGVYSPTASSSQANHIFNTTFDTNTV